MKQRISLLFLVFIIFLGILTRFYQLGRIPSGLYLDEAAQGYSAYSILKTGKDEFGKSFPVVFRSFNDFKTPIYIYLIVPLIPLFGLNAFTIRLPSFIFSILTLPLLYFLLKKLAGKHPGSTIIALISVLFLSISPWHTLFGRTNFECNVALFLLLLGYFLFLLGLKKPFWLLVSALTFAVAFPAYHSERLLVPITIFVLTIQYWPTLSAKTHFKFSLAGLFLGLVLVSPTLRILLTPGFMARVSTLNIFSTPVSLLPEYLPDYSGAYSSLINSHAYLSIKEFFSLYTFYYSPRSLFLLGDSGPRSSFPELSVFYLWQLPLYFYGLYLLFWDKKLGELRNFTIFLLLISPLPAAITRDPFSTIRALPLVIPIVIIMSLAIERLLRQLTTFRTKCLAGSLFLFLIIYSLAKLYSSGLVLNEFYRANYWDYGWEQVADVIKTLDPTIPIVIDNARGEPYSQLLVFLQYDPRLYQSENFEVSPEEYYTNMGRNTNKHIGQIITRGIDWTPDNQKDQYLIGDYLAISSEQILKNHLLLVKEIKYPDGSPAFRIVKTQPGKLSKPL